MFTGESNLDKIEPLPEDFDPSAVINDPLLPSVDDGEKKEREIVLGRNVHTMCLEVKEPDADDEVTGEREAYMAGVLARYRKSLIERTKHHLGYPYNLDFDYGALAQLQHFSINNLGDPFIESNYGVHSRQFEVGVLDWFARLWELEKNEYWGYITNCGTEGNLHGLLVGREVFPDGILYASRESHYSVFKAARMYRIECEKVNTLVSGEIDCEDFKAKLLCHKDKPAIINVNIGTTVKGAVDDLDLVIQTLEETGFTHDWFYIHCDGALFGLMMPFVKCAPKVTFKKPIGSVSVSGHKFMGCPMPCGVQITRLEHINALSRNVEYLASRDATIMGSRNGHAPIFLWYTLNRKGYRGFQKEVQKCLRNAHYLKDRLNADGIGAMLNELSSTVVFERPQDEDFVRKWQLACQGNIAHVVVMPNITVEKLDDFLSELIEKRATWYQDGKLQSPCVASDIGVATNISSRANWKDPELYKLFLDSCLKEANNGGKSGGSLKRESWDKIKKIMTEEKNVELSQRQMKNQWDYMKKKYLTWKTLMKNIGNGNDPDTKNWGAEKWNDYIKENPDAKQFRYVGLQYIDELKSLFDGITMIGQAAQSPSRTCLFSDGVKNSASSQPEVGSSQIRIDLESSSSIMPSNQSKDKLPKGKRRKSNKYGDLDDHLSAILKTLEKSDGPSIEECHHYLDGIQTLQVDDPLYIAACSIFCEGKAHRVQWILLAQKPEEVRITWIKMNAKKLGFL